MIVRFSTRYGQLTMLGEAAIELIRLLGHSGTVPGALLADELPAALGRLRSGLVSAGSSVSPAPTSAARSAEEDDEEDDANRPPPVTLSMRAVPLIDMIETAIRAGDSDLMWERG